MGERSIGLLHWVGRWGFAALVAAAVLAAVAAAWQVHPPAQIPSFALQAAAVYRLEVGGAVFVGAYLASMALVLALNNRAFSEIGMSGVKAHVISERQERAIQRQEEEVKALRRIVKTLEAETHHDDQATS
jgi:hypothetical protein